MLKEYLNKIPHYGKDLKLNLSRVLTTQPGSDLPDMQILGIALASSYTTKDSKLIEVMLNYSKNILDDAHVNAAKSAASIMGMNNIYYRFIHLIENEDIKKIPANLRMSIIANPGIDKETFELFSLAVSAINGCGLCMDSHTKTLLRENVSKTTIQHSIQIAAVINGIAQVNSIEAN